MPVIKGEILVRDYGQEYLVTVREPLPTNGCPRMVVSKRTLLGWDNSSVPPMEAVRAKALAIAAINNMFFSVCQQGV